MLKSYWHPNYVIHRPLWWFLASCQHLASLWILVLDKQHFFCRKRLDIHRFIHVICVLAHHLCSLYIDACTAENGRSMIYDSTAPIKSRLSCSRAIEWFPLRLHGRKTSHISDTISHIVPMMHSSLQSEVRSYSTTTESIMMHVYIMHTCIKSINIKPYPEISFLPLTVGLCNS